MRGVSSRCAASVTFLSKHERIAVEIGLSDQGNELLLGFAGPSV